ncbi:MAG: hypothetical protein M3481_01645 [Actinomycetota bacterium]|nr:hypothetical protein [Actinomycetota bacterium]
MLEPRVRGHVERGLSVFLLAAPPHAGVAQLRFREYLFTGEPICYLDHEPLRAVARPTLKTARSAALGADVVLAAGFVVKRHCAVSLFGCRCSPGAAGRPGQSRVPGRS